MPIRGPGAILIAIALAGWPAHAHDVWSDGRTVSPAVRARCCGDAEAHVLAPSQILPDTSGFLISANGKTLHVLREEVMPSPDGRIWGFWSDAQSAPAVHCFFMPGGSV